MKNVEKTFAFLRKIPLKYYGIIGIIFLSISGSVLWFFYRGTDRTPVRIAYFLGGRTSLLFRAYINNSFEKGNIPVDFITHSLRDNDNYYVLPKDYRVLEKNPLIAKATGVELLEEMKNGRADGATPGESSFIIGVHQGIPMVAVAELGHDLKDKPGHAIIFRSDVPIRQSSDIRGKTLVSRRAGPGDSVFLKEFLRSEGIREDEVTIKEQIDDDVYQNKLWNGEIDGGYYHLTQLDDMVSLGRAYIYRKLDWVNPELSQALLVFRKDFVEKYPEKVKRIIRVYMQQIRYEHNLPSEERMKDSEKNLRSGLQMEKEFHGMNIPQYDMPPTVSLDLLNEMQELLFRHGEIDKKIDLAPFIDNSFVEEIYREGNY